MNSRQQLLSQFVRVALVLVSAAVASPLFAADSRPLTVDHTVMLSGQAVPPGTYRLAWKDGEVADEVTVQVLAGKKVVATASARSVRLNAASPYEAFVFVPSTEGARELVEIRFAGSHDAIRIDGAASAKVHGSTTDLAGR